MIADGGCPLGHGGMQKAADKVDEALRKALA